MKTMKGAIYIEGRTILCESFSIDEIGIKTYNDGHKGELVRYEYIKKIWGNTVPRDNFVCAIINSSNDPNMETGPNLVELRSKIKQWIITTFDLIPAKMSNEEAIKEIRRISDDNCEFNDLRHLIEDLDNKLGSTINVTDSDTYFAQLKSKIKEKIEELKNEQSQLDFEIDEIEKIYADFFVEEKAKEE